MAVANTVARKPRERHARDDKPAAPPAGQGHRGRLVGPGAGERRRFVLVGVRRSSRLHQAIGCYSAEFEEILNIAADDEFG